MFSKRRNTTIINTQVLKIKTDKIAKRVMRDAKKRIKRGELLDAHSLSMYLRTVDSYYDHIEADVKNSTMIVSYDAVRAAKIAETRRMIGFYDRDFDELRNLYRDLMEKAQETGWTSDTKQDISAPPDMNTLKLTFEKLAHDVVTPVKSHPANSTPKRSI